MQAISQTIEVKNNTFSMVLPKNFTAKSVQVIVLEIDETEINKSDFIENSNKQKVKIYNLN